VTQEKHVYEVRPRKDRRGFDLISDALPFGRLWYGEPNAISNAVDYAKFYSRSHDAVIRVYGAAGDVIELRPCAWVIREENSIFGKHKNERNTMNNVKLNGKVALVTGGTSGIGKATAIAFARAGAKVVLTGRGEKEGAQVVAEIKKLGRDAAFVHADVAKDADVKAMVDFTVAKYGRLDVAFNNAGVEWKGPLEKATEAEYRRIFDINVWGVLNSMRHEIPAMLKNGGGAIVNTSAVAGHVGMGQVSILTASKHAVEGLTKALALEFAKQNIRINAVAPAGVATDMVDRFAGKEGEMRDYFTSLHPVGRIGTSEEIAAAVLYLCSDEAKFTIGTSLVVDGGYLAQ
jgi:NAD(P)-dependent dehydrogenase (short-subunit alcohol dehydrogenase family)